MGIAILLLLVLLVAAITVAVLGVHALLLGRMPGRRLPRLVRQPRLWGAGALLVLVSWNLESGTLFVVSLGLIALGHVVKPTP
ncbi:hypothetical protein N4G69_10765 [Streptomyces mirabilis]|uniref:hypothetical protein n=1 Tax=Streptomyces mirabilis TaxID=68239 RepID=UPI0021C1A8C1|nr:hypothetical protein [Streptomyces mirabilis]MCT9106106.1 hypothetical protein [Streptomyces mirabilis]